MPMQEFPVLFELMNSRTQQRMSTKTRVLAYVLAFYGLKYCLKNILSPRSLSVSSLLRAYERA